jgi:polyisoprenyl-phosphate glycosyltransferase
MARSLDDTFVLSVVSPVYNERDSVRPLFGEIRAALDKSSFPGRLEMIWVNDGSTDGSGAELDAMALEAPGETRVVHLARNFGQEVAIAAGLDHATGHAVAVIDSDLQDDPSALGALLDKWREGYDVVYAVRASREEPAWQRLAFWLFYRGLKRIAAIDLPLDASNFALMDRRVAAQLRAMPERNRYLRGLRAWVGYRQTGVPVARRARSRSRSRLGLRGQWKQAMDAVFSFSYVPLFAFRVLGVLSVGLSVLLILWALYAKLVMNIDVKSWASLMVAVSFFGGMNLLGLGIVGEYLARVFDEVRARPLYTVDRVTDLRGAMSTEADRELTDEPVVR